MKKNCKFRNNGNGCSNAYSLNYRFDSISPAGKCSGTALDLIKRYNELAKESHGAGDYVAMEMYRQYAEHYRKIVTEINERKAIRAEAEGTADNAIENTEANADTQPQSNNREESPSPKPETPEVKAPRKFQVIEIRPDQEKLPADAEIVQKPKRVIRRRKPVLDEQVTTPAENQ